MLHGRYDESHPLPTEGEPVYRLMRGESELVVFDGGHIAPRDLLMSTLTKFFDSKLGPVR
jgi:hypothetical protein